MHEDIVYLNKNDVLTLYADLFGLSEQESEASLIRDDLLESALASPRNHAMYEGADTIEQAAWLGQAIARNHAFVDGNKRITLAVVQTFLGYNSATITCSDDYLAAWVIALTLGMSADIFAACLRSFIAPLA
jgi:death-on-curing protein